MVAVVATLFSACKNEPTAASAEAASTAADSTERKSAIKVLPTPDSIQQAAAATTMVPAPATAKPINYVGTDRILLKDNTEIQMPKADDKSSIVIFFATPGPRDPKNLSGLSQEGTLQAGRLTGTMARAGLSVVWAEGNLGMQSALGTAKENQAEFNLLDPKTADEALKTTVHNYMGKKVMIVASPSIISNLMVQLAGKQVVQVPNGYSPVLYVAKAKGIGNAEITEMAY